MAKFLSFQYTGTMLSGDPDEQESFNPCRIIIPAQNISYSVINMSLYMGTQWRLNSRADQVDLNPI